jgi:hypothetical protein
MVRCHQPIGIENLVPQLAVRSDFYEQRDNIQVSNSASNVEWTFSILDITYYNNHAREMLTESLKSRFAPSSKSRFAIWRFPLAQARWNGVALYCGGMMLNLEEETNIILSISISSCLKKSDDDLTMTSIACKMQWRIILL